MTPHLADTDLSVLEEVVRACGSQPRAKSSNSNLWNDLCLYSQFAHPGQATLLQQVAELLIRQPRVERLLDTPGCYVVPACHDAMPLAAAVHMLTGVVMPSYVTTRFGYIWLTDAPPEEGNRGAVVVVDTVMRKGACAARAQSQLSYAIGNDRALYAVLADFFRPCNRPGESRATVTGWPDSSFMALLSADEHWRFEGQGLAPGLTGPFLPMDELCLTPGYSIQEVFGVSRSAAHDGRNGRPG